jgi:hypothetical protein
VNYKIIIDKNILIKMEFIEYNGKSEDFPGSWDHVLADDVKTYVPVVERLHWAYGYPIIRNIFYMLGTNKNRDIYYVYPDFGNKYYIYASEDLNKAKFFVENFIVKGLNNELLTSETRIFDLQEYTQKLSQIIKIVEEK